MDGSHFKFHAGAAAEPVFAAWGITTDGQPVLLALAPGTSESHDAWAEFLAELAARALSHRCSSSPTARRRELQAPVAVTVEHEVGPDLARSVLPQAH